MTSSTAPDPEGKKGMALSVVVPVLNGAATVREALEALAAQEVPASWEVVVADNGSTDGTRDIIRSLAPSFPVPLRLVDASAARGAAFACNAGALAAAGASIAFCAADDRVGDGWIASALESLTAAEAVGGPLRELRTPHDPLAPVLRHSVERSAVSGLPLMIGTGNFAIHRERFTSVGGLDISMRRYGGEDNELSVRLMEAQVYPAVNEDMVLYFRQTTSFLQSLRKVYSAALAEVDIWRRHPDLFAAENNPQWTRGAIRRLPKELVRTARTRNLRKVVRLLVRRVGNFRAQSQVPRRPVDIAHIDQMAVPRDITAGD